MIIKLVVSMIFLLSTSTVIAKPNYDYVKSARVNNLEMTKNQSYQSIQSAFGKAMNQPKFKYDNQCTGNPEASIKYNNKLITLEYFPEENPSGISLTNLYSKASVWIYWQNTGTMTDKIVIGKQIISGNISFEQFKKMFPNSAENGMDGGSNKGEKIYTILLGGDPKDDEDIAYRPHINFIFVNDKLLSLTLEQGIAC